MKFLSKNLSNLKGKTVLLRLDLNEPVDSRNKLLDDFRLRAALPTIKKIHNAGAKLIIVAHRGRPNGSWDAELSLAPMAKTLADLLKYKYSYSRTKTPDYPVKHLLFFKGDITEKESVAAIKQSHQRNIIVLENIRFYPGEEKNLLTFAGQLAKLADLYVNDAFAVSHRKSASVVAITKKLPSFAGLLLEQEIKNLKHLVTGRIKKPFVLVMGGVKISSKAKTLKTLGKRADAILLGGGLANLFLSHQGMEIGKSVFEKDSLPLAKQVALNFKNKIVLPRDVIVKSSGRSGKAQHKPVYKITKADNIYDIGPDSILAYSKILKTAGTICWNGPLGYFEEKPFHTGTFALARIIGGVGKRKAFVVAGGGETVAAVRETGQFDHYDHVSTGGGSMLVFLSGNELPGIAALQ